MVHLSHTDDGARRPAPSIEWLRSPARPALQVASALDRVRRAPTILDAMRAAPGVSRLTGAGVADGIALRHLTEPLLEAIRDDADSVTAIAAVHALARIPGPRAEAQLAELLSVGPPGLEDHAVWALGERVASVDLLEYLGPAVVRGRLAGMHAQRVLARWARTIDEPVVDMLEECLGRTTLSASRRHLVETAGLVPGGRARAILERVAADEDEDVTVRETAIAAFAERLQERLPSAIGRLASASGRVGSAVRRVRAQRHLSRRGPRRWHERAAGLTVAQVHLGAVLDAEMSRAGMGDTGGVATLLARLGARLAEQPRVAEVITIGRTTADAVAAPSRRGRGHRFEAVVLEDGEGGSFVSSWPSLVAAERGIRAALLGSGVPDVMHLRMADPGSLAAAAIARELGIATVFTLAPDPHGPIAAAERTGTLDRRSFAREDARSALWYRAHLVERLATQSAELALFPRRGLRTQLRDLVGLDIATGSPRHTVVPEGIDVERADRADAAIRFARREPPVVADLRRAIEALPAARHGLPITVSVGRMHEMKGMARVVEAFALDTHLAEASNLVIVGGDLDAPGAIEAAELARIQRHFERYPGLEGRVVLMGHRPNDDVSLILAVARHGWGDPIAPGGAYVCGSLKEEFGLAIVEAMAAGLPVVVPQAGGPATYVDDGVTGMVVDTSDVLAIGLAVGNALRLARDARTAHRARAVVDGRFTLERMARTLAAVYRVASGPRTLAAPVHAGVAP